jgi:hypothetical protein
MQSSNILSQMHQQQGFMPKTGQDMTLARENEGKDNTDPRDQEYSTVPLGRLLSSRLSSLLLRLRSAADALPSLIGPLGLGLSALHVPWLPGLPRLETVAPAAGVPPDGPGAE